MQYELFYLVGGSKEAELEKIKAEVEDIVIKNDGKFSEKETLDKRRMAYAIKHDTHGIYVARRFEIEPEKISEITKKLNLNLNVLRFIISRADELPELLSKEERIRAAVKETAIAREIQKPKVVEEKTGKTEVTKKPETPQQEDIDKKLEEILNI